MATHMPLDMNLRKLLLPLASLALALAHPAPSRAATDKDLVAYLNDQFMPKLWPAMQNFLGNHTIHRVVTETKAEGLDVHLDKTSFDFSGIPRFELQYPLPFFGSHGAPYLVGRFPGTGEYTFRTNVTKHVDVIWDADVDLVVSVHVLAFVHSDHTELVPIVDVSADGNITTDLAVGDAEIARTIKTRLETQLPGLMKTFEQMRFDLSRPLPALVPELISAASGSPDLDPRSALDVFLVSDGFANPSATGPFEGASLDLARKVSTFDPATHVSEPLASFASNLRFWRLRAPASAVPLPAERATTSVFDDTTNTTVVSFLNLARLAEVGLAARNADVIVFLSEASLLSGNARARAMGNLVLLPSSDAATVLVHELGHTSLGGGLADEYADFTDTYHGLEPTAPNVSTSVLFSKISSWWSLPASVYMPWDQRVTAFEGGYGFTQGIVRANEHCKMRDSSADVPFCPVCREATTRAVRRTLGGNSVLVQHEILRPFKKGTTRMNVLGAGQALQGQALEGFSGTRLDGLDPDTQVRMSLAAASLPKPWRARWSVISPTGSTVYTIEQTSDTGTTPAPVTLSVRFGGRIALQVSSTSRYTPHDTLPTFTVEWPVTIPRLPAGITPPTALRQSVAVGGTAPIAFDPMTGNARALLELSVAGGGFPGWELPTNTELRVTGPQGVSRSFIARPGSRVAWNPGLLPGGVYQWSARSGLGAEASPWVSLPLLPGEPGHFVVAPLLSTTPTAPVAPVELRAIPGGAAIGRRLGFVELNATSWDANGDAIRLQFEVRPSRQALTGTPTQETALTLPPSGTLRVNASVSIAPPLESTRWQVRAVDATGRTSAWTTGGTLLPQLLRRQLRAAQRAEAALAH